LGILLRLKGLWCTDRPRTAKGTGAGVYGQSADRRLSISLGTHATVFQAKVHAILDCIHETETQNRPDKCASGCETSHLVRKCQNALNEISTLHAVGSRGKPDYEEMKSPTSSQETLLFKGWLDLSLSWGSLGRI